VRDDRDKLLIEFPIFEQSNMNEEIHELVTRQDRKAGTGRNPTPAHSAANPVP
jgi:hypothetical protein